MTLNEVTICKSFLLGGYDLPLSEELTVKHPSVEEILKLGNGIYCDYIYLGYVAAMLSDPYDNMVWLDDRHIDFENVADFDVFILKLEEILERLSADENEQEANVELRTIGNAISFFLGDHVFDIGVDSDGAKYLFDINQEDIRIGFKEFRYITTFIEMCNGIDHAGRIRPANKSAKQILIEDRRSELKRKSRKKDDANEDYIGDMISAVVNGGNGGINPFNFKRLKFYQLFSAMKVEQKKIHFDHIMSAVYHGTMSYDKIGEQEKNWMR